MRKRQWKKILSVVLALAMVFSMNTAVFADEVVSDNEPAVEAPVAEEPVAEAPVESNEETPEETKTEEAAPAEEEAPAEEAAPVEEEAAPAEEEASAEEAAPVEEEAAPAEEEAPAEEAAPVEEAAEEAAGINWSEKGDTFEVSVVDNSGAAIDGATASVNKAEGEGIWNISVNKASAIDDDTKLLINGTSATSINKIFVSTNQTGTIDKINGLILSGNKVAYNDEKIYREDTEAEIGADFKVKAGHLQLKNDGEFVAAGAVAVNYEGGYIYRDEPVELAFSANNWTISFDAAIQEAYYGSDTANKITSEATSKGADIDVSKIIGASALTGIYVKTGDDSYASADNDIPAKAAVKNVTSATVSSSGAEFVFEAAASGYTTSYIVVPGSIKEDLLEKAMEATEWIPTSETEWNEGTEKSTYTVIVRNAKEDKGEFSNYAGYFFKTGAKNSGVGSYTATNDWKAYNTLDKNVTYTVSVNEKNGLLINNVPESGVTSITIEVSSNEADLVVDGVTLSVNATATAVKDVILVASANGVKVEDAGVYVLTNNSDTATPLSKSLESDSNQVIVSEEGYGYIDTPGREIKDNTGVYVPAELSVADKKGITADLDAVTITLSENGKIVGTEEVELEAGVAADADKFVASQNVIIEYDEAVDGYKYAVVNIPDAVADVADTVISAYDHESFTIKNTNDTGFKTRYVYGTEKLTDIAAVKAEDWTKAVSLNQTGYTYKVSTNEPGQTYYVYKKVISDGTNFARYSEEPLEVTLGVHKVVKLKLAANKAFFKGDKFTNKNVITVDDDSPTYVSANKTVKITEDDIEKITVTPEGGNYSISANVKDAAKQTLNDAPGVDLDYGKTKYTILSENAAITAPTDDHNKWTVTLTDGEFTTLSDDSALTIDSSVKYYFGQSAADLSDNAKTSGATADSTKLGKDDKLTVKVSKTVSGDKLGDEITDEDLQKLDKDTEIHAQFWLQGKISSNIIDLTVEARPVAIFAEQNFFSKLDDAYADNAVDVANLNMIDLYGTAYEKESTKKIDYVKTTGVKADFAEVVSDNLAKAGAAQDYMLDLEGKDEATEKSISSGNIVINGESDGNAEGFGYYVAPVYALGFRGAFKTALYDGKTISKNDTTTIDSAAAADLANIAKDYKSKKIDDKVKFTAEVTLPTNVVVTGASKFEAWKNVNSGATFKAGDKDIISDNTAYSAVVKQAVPGFVSGNAALQVVFDADGLTYTGKKHVTNPGAQVDEYIGKNGYENAVNALINNANNGCADVQLDVYVGDKLLLEGYDYNAVYKNNINAYDVETGKKESNFSKKAPQVTITFKGGYANYPAITKYFSIEKADITDENIVGGTATDSLYYKADTKGSKVKTGLYNIYTGAALVANNNGKKDIIITPDVSGKMTAGEHKVVIKGAENNYTGEIEETINVVAKSDYVNVTLKANNKNDYKVDFTNGDTYGDVVENEDYLRKAVIASMAATKKTKTLSPDALDEIIASPVKGQDYIVPGVKKIAYKAYVPVEDSKVYVLKGTFQYVINKVNASDIVVTFDEVPDGGVEYVPTGATLGYETSFKGEGADLSRILTVKYSKNKNPGKEGVAKPTAVKKAYIQGSFTPVKFLVGTAKLDEDNIALAYIVAGDVKTSDAKTQKAVAKRGSVVIKDDLGNILKAGRDYTLAKGKITVTESGNDTIEMNIKGKGKYSGEAELDVQLLESNFLGSMSLKQKTTKDMKTFTVDEMSALEEGTDGVSTNSIAAAHGIDVYNGKNAAAKIGVDYNIVITPAGKGGVAYVTAVGIDGGAFGGSDVLAKKAIKVKVK